MERTLQFWQAGVISSFPELSPRYPSATRPVWGAARQERPTLSRDPPQTQNELLAAPIHRECGAVEWLDGAGAWEHGGLRGADPDDNSLEPDRCWR